MTRACISVQAILAQTITSLLDPRTGLVQLPQSVCRMEGQQAEKTAEFALNSWSDFLRYVIEADIHFVRPHFLLRLNEEGKVWPRRQEAELVDALYKPRIGQRFQFIAISHCWEAREHPDPLGFQGHQLANAIRFATAQGQIQDTTVFFIDYISLPQFKRASQHQEDSFRRSMANMHLLYANSSADFCAGVWIVPCLTPWFNLSWSLHSWLGKSVPVYSVPDDEVAEVPLAMLVPNATPYARRGWCRAELEWASPYMRDACALAGSSGRCTLDCSLSLIERSVNWAFGLYMLCFLILVILTLFWVFTDLLGVFTDVLGLEQKETSDKQDKPEAAPASSPIVDYVISSFVLVVFIGSCCLPVHELRKKGHTGRLLVHTSRIPLTPENFQQQASGRQLIFTHRSDEEAVLKLQEEVFLQKCEAVNDFVYNFLPSQASLELPTLMTHYSHLARFELRRASLAETVSANLVSSLVEKPTMRELCLCTVRMKLQAGFIEILSENLKGYYGSSRLEKLCLEDCGMGNAEAQVLAESLGVNGTLRELSLGKGCIGEIGAMALAATGAQNRTLQRLDLHFNCISCRGLEALDAAWPSLKLLDLSYNEGSSGDHKYKPSPCEGRKVESSGTTGLHVRACWMLVQWMPLRCAFYISERCRPVTPFEHNHGFPATQATYLCRVLCQLLVMSWQPLKASCACIWTAFRRTCASYDRLGDPLSQEPVQGF